MGAVHEDLGVATIERGDHVRPVIDAHRGRRHNVRVALVSGVGTCWREQNVEDERLCRLIVIEFCTSKDMHRRDITSTQEQSLLYC